MLVHSPCFDHLRSLLSGQRGTTGAATEPHMTIATANALHDIGIARQIGTYSDAVDVLAHARWLFTAGTPWLAADGTLPAGITAQAEHIDHMLRKDSRSIWSAPRISPPMRRSVPVCLPAHDRRQCCWSCQALVRPGFLLEVEAVAAKAE